MQTCPQYKQLRDHAGTLDLGFMKVHNRFISEIDFSAGSSMSGDRDKKSSTIRYLGAGIDIGYDVIPSEKFYFIHWLALADKDTRHVL